MGVLHKLFVYILFYGISSFVVSAQNTSGIQFFLDRNLKSKNAIEFDKAFVTETIALYGSKEKAFSTFIDVGWRGIIERKFDESAQDFNKAWLLDSANADSYLGYSFILQLKNNDIESEKLFQQGIALDKNKTAQIKYYQRANDYAGRTKDTILLIKLLNESLVVCSDTITTLSKIAQYNALKGFNKEAIDAFGKVIQIKPNDFSCYYNRGILLKKMQKSTEAIADFTKAFMLSNEKHFDSVLQRGLLKFETGDYAGSIDDYNTCISMQSKNATLYRFLGISKSMIYDQKGACNAWKTAKKYGDLPAEELFNAQCR